MMADTKTEKRTSIGGQALIEGVMMRGPHKTAMAVRDPAGQIVLEQWDNPVNKRPAWTKWPFVRGLFNFYDSMRYGYKCLMRSAELSGLDDEDDGKAKKADEKKGETAEAAGGGQNAASAETADAEQEPGHVRSADGKQSAGSTENADGEQEPEHVRSADGEQSAGSTENADGEQSTKSAENANGKQGAKSKDSAMTVVMIAATVLGVGLALILFMWLPIQLFSWLAKAVPEIDHRYIRGVFEGVLRIVIFLAYMLAVSRMKDIRRTFQYHGAEHKTILCYEKGLPLTVENVRPQRRFHPRCGTSFLILMLIVGILISILIPIETPLLRTAVKLLLLPLTVGIGYELIKLAGRKDNAFTRIISAPGMWMQHITTIEPDDGMIECAIASLKAVIPNDPEDDRW